MTNPALLSTALGEPRSGRVRYAAAMALFQEGRITAAQLECYRIAAADDWLDPAALLRESSLEVPIVDEPSPEAIIQSLVDEADVYLSRLPGPGVAELRRGIAAFRHGTFTQQGPSTQSASPPVTKNEVVAQYLPAALAAAAATQPALCACIASAAPLLNWITYDLYDRKAIGAAFADSHAFCTIIGESGPIHASDFDLGLFLIAPDILYRDHCHAAPELYAPLTGPHGWRFAPGAPLIIKPAHEPVWNEPFQPHLTKTGPIPFLCLYGWTRDTSKPAQVLPAADWQDLENKPLLGWT